MEEVRFDEYDGKERNTSRFFHDEDERRDMPFAVKAGIGIAVAAGVLTTAHRTGAMRKIAHFLDTEGRATVHALREVRDTQGRLFTGVDKLTPTQIKKQADHFSERRADILHKLKQSRAQSNILESREFQLAKNLEQQHNLLKENGELPYTIREGYRFNAVMDEIRNHPSMQGKEDVVQELRNALEKGKLGMLDRGSDEKLRLLLKQHNKNLDTDDVFSVLKQSREKYQGEHFSPKKDEALRLIQGMQEKIRHSTAELMQTSTKKDNAFKQFIVGHKQATVDDILKLNDAGKIRVNPDLRAQIDDAVKKNDDFRKSVFDESLYLSTKNGKLFDYKVFNKAKRDTADWWSNTIPGGLLHLRDILNVKEAREQAGIKIFQRGTTLSALNGHMGVAANEALHEEVLFMYGKFVKLHDVDAINNNTALNVINKTRDMHLTSSQFGTEGKMFRQMSGMMTDNDSPRNVLFEIADVGRQDKDSVIGQVVSVGTKFFKKDWDRNQIRNAIHNGIKTPEEFFDMNTYFKLNTKGLSSRVLNHLKDTNSFSSHVMEFLHQNDINFSKDEDMVKLFKYIGEKEKGNGNTNSPYTDLKNLHRQFERNPDQVLNQKTPIGESNPIIGHHTHIRTGLDDINQQTSMYLMQDMMMSRPGEGVYKNLANTFRQELRGMHADGKIWRDDLDQAEQLVNYSLFRSQGFNVHDSRDAAVNRVSKLFTENEPFQESMRTMARKTNPLWERYSTRKPDNKVGDEYLAINNTNITGIFNQMFGIHSSVEDRVKGLKDLSKQLSPFTGRRNMQDVTTLTMFGTYYPWYRLQDSLGNMGLGFSDQSMGNTVQMASALLLKRIFPLYAGVEAGNYINYETDKHTGEGMDERWENYKANDRLDKAATRTPEDIYDANRRRSLKPGLEHWEDMPSIHIPGIGPVGMGDVLNTISAPFTGYAPLRKEDTMTYDETMDDLYNGEEPIRKSRYWLSGSKSAYRGDRIKEFAPNSFRLAHSDWEDTENGTQGEDYWRNSLFPTLENPLGGLSFALGTRDPYWYEKKHEYDRPYMLTGELFNPNTMILGDIGNATIGKLIKPVKEMHPEYWGDPVAIYENETSKEGKRPIAPIRTTVSPAGRTENDVLATPDDYGAEQQSGIIVVPTDNTSEEALANSEVEQGNSPARYFVSSELDQKGNPTGAYVAQDIETSKSMYVPANVAKEDLSMGKLFDIADTQAPEGSYVKAVGVSSENPSYQTQVSTQPRAMMDEEYAYRQDIMNRKMMNMKDPRDGSWRLQEGMENWSEPLGVYKWILGDMVLGNDPYKGQMVMQRADAAYNASNRFWESELGSLGGEMSEIGRRFIRRDSGQLDQYNPISNTMPDWLPGDNYFLNLKIGDPYSKIPDGERRLPGEAYESLNELHPDETGRYGAFDKFKILADVAPWSDEYKFWSQYLLDTQKKGSDLRKEASNIRRQVSKRKEKYDFTPYKFKGNDVVYQDVTVTKFLDDYTFLTKELGDQTIRIAGMEYRKKADGVLQQYFKVGDKVSIGIAKEEDKRIAKDTYGTMRAVIFNKLGNINKDIIERGAMVENQNDFSAPGIVARYTPKEISQGSRWESLAHTSSPLNTKFLQVRSAVEEYERDQVYGRDWATWDQFLIKDYIKPALQGVGRFDNPLWSGLAGGTTGLLLGRLFLKGGRPTKIAGIAGALFGLGSNMFFKNYEKKHGEAWIPENRRKEQDINEYFDVLKYMKYEGLYQKSREEIAHQTGYDVEDFASIIGEQKDLTKQRREELETERKQLFITQPKGWEDKRKEINAELSTISENFNELYLPDSFLQALQYKDERDTTLYGIDPYDDRMKVMKAFPYKDKWFFQEFVDANDEEKQKILKLIPENERRVYKALWGMDTEEQKPLDYYMQKYDIPNWDWEGWKPEYNLDDIKVKAVQEAGIDLTDFNFWEDDIQASQYTPNLHDDGNSIQGEPASSFSGYNALRQNIEGILQGQGLQDVQVIVQPAYGSETSVDINHTEDRSKEIEDNLRMYGKQYV